MLPHYCSITIRVIIAVTGQFLIDALFIIFTFIRHFDLQHLVLSQEHPQAELA